MGILSILSLIWGILAIIGMAVAIIPFLGALNYLNIPFAVLGIAFQHLCSDRIIKERGRCCWLYPLWRSDFLGCHPARFRLRNFLRCHSCNSVIQILSALQRSAMSIEGDH